MFTEAKMAWLSVGFCVADGHHSAQGAMAVPSHRGFAGRLAVGGGRHAGELLERAVEVGKVVEAQGVGNLLYRRRLGEQP